VTKAASGDELFGSFAEAAFVTALRLFTGLDIQDHIDLKERLFSVCFVILRGYTNFKTALAVPLRRAG
jgi:hypothetical protein